MNRLFLIFGILILIIGCKSTNINNKPDFSTKNDSINLYAFIGQKISITEFDPNENRTITIEIDSINGDTIFRHDRYVMDYGFKAKYKVIKNVFNDLKTDTIDFVIYDHYGQPGFENLDYVLLYISKNSNGEYYHRKYQYDMLLKNKSGKYFSYPKEFYGLNYYEIANTIKSFEVDLEDKVFIDISGFNNTRIQINYPSKYYSIKNNYAYPKRGMFIDDLVQFRLKTTFKDL